MKFAEKDISYYWKIFKIPLLILLSWSIVGFIISLSSYQTYKSIFSGIVGLVVSVALYGITGYLAVADHKATIKQSAWSGALLGITAGFIGGIIGILMFNLVPEFVADTVRDAVAQGAQAELTKNIMKISTYIGPITGPIFGGLIGALIAAIGGFISKKT